MPGSRLLAALLLVALLSLVHAGSLLVPLLGLADADSLGNGFHYDDGHSLLRNPHIRDLSNLPAFFSQPELFSENPQYAMYRPMVLVAHALNYGWGGDESAGYHLLNLAVHAAASLLVFALLLQLGLGVSAALLGALLFGLHPVQTEPVNSISARSESLAGLFYLSAFLCYLRSVPVASPRAPLWRLASLGAFALSLLSKATALTLPLALLLYELVAPQAPGPARGPVRGRVPNLRVHLPYWLLAGAYLLLYHALSPESLARAGQVRDASVQLATQGKAVVHYLKLALVPVSMNVHQQFSVAPTLWGASPLLSLLAGGSLVAAAFQLRRRIPLAAFGLAWFLLALLPTLVVPLHILVNDHRLYLSLFGLAVAVARFADRMGRHWPLYLLCGLFGLICFQRSQVWRDEVTLWGDAVRRAPLMPEAHYNLGHAWHEAGDLDRARLAYERAVQLSPIYARAQTNLGLVYREQGKAEGAIRAFQAALRAEPEMVEALSNLGLVYTAERRLDEAVGLFRRALDLDPDRAEVWLNLGLAYRDQGRMDEAFQALSRAIRLQPELKERFPVPR